MTATAARGLTRIASRAYLLLDVRRGALENVVEKLAAVPGVVSVEVVGGRPDLVVITEAPDFEGLVSLTVDALIHVEEDTERVRCLPVYGNGFPPGVSP